MVMSPGILSNEQTTANNMVNDAGLLQASEFSPGGGMAPTVINNYNGSTAGQGRLLQTTDASNDNGGLFGFSPNQVGQIAGKGITNLANPSSSFNQFLNNVDNFGTNFGFGAPSSGTAASGGDLVTAGVDHLTATAQNAFGQALSQGMTDNTIANATANGLGDTVAGFDTASGATNLTAANSLSDVTGAAAGSIPSLTSVLGAAGLGALGGSLIANLTGGNPVGGSIGGAIGAGIGEAGGAAAASALGLELGSFAGPAGAIVGGIGGSLIGGMFGGNKPATSASEFLFNPGTGSASYGAKGNTSGANAQLETQFSQMTQGVSNALGIKFNPNAPIYGGINTLHSGGPSPGFIGVTGGQRYYFTPGDPNSTNAAMQSAITDAAKLSGFTDTNALSNYFNSSAGSVSLPQNTPNVTPNPGSFAAFIAQQNQGKQQNVSSPTTAAV